MNNPACTVSQKLLELAGFVTRHRIPDAEIVSADAAGYGSYLHLDPPAFDRLVGSEWEADGEHVSAMVEGVKLKTLLDHGQRFRANPPGYKDGYADGFKAATENAAKQPIMEQIDAQPAGVRCEAGSVGSSREP